jgi:hypothetical protein
VGKVPESDVFDVVDVDHVTDGAAVDDLLDLEAWREVPGVDFMSHLQPKMFWVAFKIIELWTK